MFRDTEWSPASISQCNRVNQRPDREQDNKSVELLYFWIKEDETGFIKEQGFNFSPAYRFEMELDGEGRYELVWTADENALNVWKYQNIANLTAVVGKNGSGKSSFLRHLATAPMQLIDRDNRKGILLIYRDGNSINVLHNLDKSNFTFNQGQPIGSKTIQVLENTKAESLLSKQTIIHITNAKPNVSTKADDNPYAPICFSPEKNAKRVRAFYEKRLGLENKQNLPNHFVRPADGGDIYGDSRSFDAFVIASHYSQMQSKDFPDTHNRQFVLGVDDLDTWMMEITGYSDVFNGDKGAATSYYNECRDILEPIRTRFQSITDVLMDTMSFEICYLLDLPSLNTNHLQNFSKVRNNPCEYLQNHMQDAPDSYAPVIKHYKQAAEAIKTLNGILEKCDAPESCRIPGMNDPSVVIKRDNDAYIEFCEFIDEQMKADTSFVLPHLTVQMPPQSSGEEALQNVFSWLNLPPYFDKIFGEAAVPIKENILLLLDEVDLYMHPEWQRKFLKMLSDRLKAEYGDNKIQIVITTHSPLVLSDIPRSNIIYLERQNDQCTIVPGPETEETFGANIFTLLKDSFFLEKSLGEFAHSRISEVLIHLHQLKDSPGDKDLIGICQTDRKLIECIGEPVIRRKLLMMYEEIVGSASAKPNDQMIELIRQLMDRKDPDARELLAKLRSMLRIADAD